MKKIFLVLLLLSFAVEVFSQELIGRRLKYEVRGEYITITDVIDDKRLSIYARRSIETIYRLSNGFTSEIILTADIYTDNFSTRIAQYITSWSLRNSGDREWQQYVSSIADKITQLLRDQNPRPVQPPVPPPPIPPSPPPQGLPQLPQNILFISQFQTGMYYVQIGSYTNIGTAMSEIEKVDRSLPRAIMQTTVNIYGIDKTVNRVLIGPLNRADSITTLQRFRQKYYDAFVWGER